MSHHNAQSWYHCKTLTKKESFYHNHHQYQDNQIDCIQNSKEKNHSQTSNEKYHNKINWWKDLQEIAGVYVKTFHLCFRFRVVHKNCFRMSKTFSLFWLLCCGVLHMLSLLSLCLLPIALVKLIHLFPLLEIQAFIFIFIFFIFFILFYFFFYFFFYLEKNKNSIKNFITLSMTLKNKSKLIKIKKKI